MRIIIGNKDLRAEYNALLTLATVQDMQLDKLRGVVEVLERRFKGTQQSITHPYNEGFADALDYAMVLIEQVLWDDDGE